MRAYKCDYCHDLTTGEPVSSLKLYVNHTPFDFDSLVCQAMWMVEQLTGDDLRSVRDYSASMLNEEVHLPT